MTIGIMAVMPNLVHDVQEIVEALKDVFDVGNKRPRKQGRNASPVYHNAMRKNLVANRDVISAPFLSVRSDRAGDVAKITGRGHPDISHVFGEVIRANSTRILHPPCLKSLS